MKLKSGFLPLALALTVSTASYGAQKNESEKVIDIEIIEDESQLGPEALDELSNGKEEGEE